MREKEPVGGRQRTVKMCRSWLLLFHVECHRGFQGRDKEKGESTGADKK